LWAEFAGDDKNLRFLVDWAPTYRREFWREAMDRCGHQANGILATELADRFVEERRKLHIVYDDVVTVLIMFHIYNKIHPSYLGWTKISFDNRFIIYLNNKGLSHE
jgi:hypothetical protein